MNGGGSLSQESRLQREAQKLVGSGQTLSIRQLWEALGRTRGVIETIGPGFAFLTAYLVSNNLLISVTIPLATALIFISVRFGQKLSVLPAVAGFGGLAASAGVALWSGRIENNFLLGLVVNSLLALILVGSLLVRRPLISVLVSSVFPNDRRFTGELALKIGQYCTVLWAGLFLLRLLVQVPIYWIGSVGILAATKLVMGLPMYAAWLWVSWLLYRTVYISQTDKK